MSPFIISKYGILIQSEDLFPANVVKMHQASHQSLNEKRIRALNKLHTRLGGPIFELKAGLIVTENDREQETTGGS